MQLTDIVGYINHTLVLILLLSLPVRWFFSENFSVLTRAIMLATLAVLVNVSVKNELSSVEFFRGFFGDLSVATLLLLLSIVCSFVAGSISWSNDSRLYFSYGYVVAAVALYPMALGFGQYDSYGLGYQPMFLLIAVLLFSLVACYKNYLFPAFVLVLATVAYKFELLESLNYWDYIIDPYVAIYSIVHVLKAVVKKYRLVYERD